MMARRFLIYFLPSAILLTALFLPPWMAFMTVVAASCWLVARGLAERQRAEAEIRHLSSFPQSNPNPIVEINRSGRILFANAAAAAVLAQQGLADALAFFGGGTEGVLSCFVDAARTGLYREVIVGQRVFGAAIHFLPELDCVRLYASDITDRKQAEEALRTSQRQLAKAMDLARVVNWEYDVARDLFTFDDRWYALYGTTPEREGGNQMPSAAYTRQFVHPDDAHLVADEIRKVLDSAAVQPAGEMEHRIVRRDGELRHFLVRYEITRDAAGRAVIVCGSSQDITEQKRTEEMLRIEQDNLKAIFAAAPVGLLLLDEQTLIVDANSVLAGMVSTNLSRIVHQCFGGGLHCVHSLENENGCGFASACPKCPLRNAIRHVLSAGTSVRGAEIQTTLVVRGQEHHLWLWVSAEPMLLHGRKHVLVAIDDITARKAMEDELRDAAQTDKLTGLPNRSLLLDRIRQAILRSRRHPGSGYAVLFLDFDRFKIINDSLGHQAGDELLCEIARRLQDAVREVDSVGRNTHGATAARLGGDEFVILLDSLHSLKDAAAVAERLLDILGTPFRLRNNNCDVVSTASIGLVTSEFGHEQAEDVLRDADTAMYEAKLMGRGRAVIFNASMRAHVQRRLELENGLRKALDGGQFLLHYQPIVSLETGRVEGFEALVRWQHPEYGMISPGEFIPVAEETGLIVRLGEWVFREACRQLGLWQKSRRREAAPSVSVNLSRVQLSIRGLPRQFRDIAREAGIDPGAIHIEVTESAIMSDANLGAEVLREIKAQGFKVDVDDFGTGYSSLACLHQFPIDVLKIDRSFITNLDRGRDFAALVHAVIALARNLRIQVVAEGIETQDQVTMLQALECQHAQGHFFARPLPAEEAIEFHAPQFVRAA